MSGRASAEAPGRRGTKPAAQGGQASASTRALLPPDQPEAGQPGALLLWLGGLLVVAIALSRAMTAHGRIAWWDLDATRTVLPETTLTPAWSLALCAVVFVGVALVGQGLARRGARAALGVWAMLLLAVLVAAYHAMLKPMGLEELPIEFAPLLERVAMPIDAALGLSGGAVDGVVRGSFESLLRAMVWISAVAGGAALLLACRAEPALRRIAMAALLSLTCVLAAKGVHQVFVEHADTVARFEASTDEVLIAQGLRPGSPSAREFERRLRHPDALGWFALSNVYGSVMAACAVAALAFLCASFERMRGPIRRRRFIFGLLMVGLAIAGLRLANSTGAMVAFGIGLAFVAWLAWSERSLMARLLAAPLRSMPAVVRRLATPTRRHAGLAMIALMGLVLLAVGVRGLIGEAIGELSLLFRWHYWTASARIWIEHPLLGVGPGEFQSAYAVAKPSVSPEQVESPHSVMIDWIATLGVGGMALSAVLCWMAWLAGTSAGRAGLEPGATREPARRRDRIALLLCIASAAALSGIRQLPTTGGSEAIIRAIGVIAMLIAAVLIARWMGDPVGRRAGRIAWIGLAGGSAVLLAHGQIEMVFTAPGSVGWVMAFLGVAAAAPAGRRMATPAFPQRDGIVLAAAASGMALLLVITAGHAARWEHRLAEAAAAARPLAELRIAVAQLDHARGQSEIARLMGTIVRRVVPPGQRINESTLLALDDLINSYERAVHRTTADRLMAAYLVEPSVPAPLRRAGGLWLAAGDLVRARAAVAILLRRFGDHDASVAAAAAMLDLIAELTTDLGDLRLAAAAWERAHGLDPMSVRPAFRLARIERAHPGTVTTNPQPGRGEKPAPPGTSRAAIWARRALWNDEMLRLDPLKKMDEAERAWLEAAAREAHNPSSQMK